MDFSIGNNQTEYCTSAIIKEFHIKYQTYLLLSKCFEIDGLNIDKFILNISKIYKNNKSSYVMDQIFKDGDWRKN